MLYKLSTEELRSVCRNYIETLEQWARRLIHERMNLKFGKEYFDCKDKNGDFIIKKAIRDKAQIFLENNPDKFNRLVDTLYLDELIYLLTHPYLYNDCFKEALDYSYPQGKEEVREFLSRITPIRNALSHSNTISIRQAEQVICYSDDFIEGLKTYYIDKGKEKMWNVPTIIQITDSFGHNIQKKQLRSGAILYVGDTYYIDVIVDPSFERDSYIIKWTANDFSIDEELYNKNRFLRKFSVSDINENFMISCSIISNKDWHRYGDVDDWFNLTLTVLPSLNL